MYLFLLEFSADTAAVRVVDVVTGSMQYQSITHKLAEGLEGRIRKALHGLDRANFSWNLSPIAESSLMSYI